MRRLAGLDGIRGLAALYVVIYHVFLRAFPGSAAEHAPLWAAAFDYGRFAVVVFIVLSGFSLGVAPARKGWRMGSVREFARRRAWRILPPYWAALVFSALMTWFVLAQPGFPRPTGKSILVNGLLLQNAVAAPSPNRAFWSIAVEAQLYVLLPLMLVMMRWVNPFVMLAAVTVVVVTAGVFTPEAKLTLYTPDLAVLFATGVAAAGIVRASQRVRSWPWPWLALGAALPVTAWITSAGPTWTLSHLFWVDLALGPAIGCLLAAVATGQPKPVVRLLDTAPLRSLGSFSYSLYLTHTPIVIAVSYGIVAGRIRPGAPMFLVLLVVLVPVTVMFARLFAAVFEIPFVRHRGRPGYRWRSVMTVKPDHAAAASTASGGPATGSPDTISGAAPTNAISTALPAPATSSGTSGSARHAAAIASSASFPTTAVATRAILSGVPTPGPAPEHDTARRR